MSNKDLYIIFSRTGTLFSNVIAFFTQKEYSHVSISLDNSFKQMYSFGRKIPEKMLPAGFVEENLYDGVFAMFPNSRCLVYKVSITSEQYEAIKNELNTFISNKDDYKYNILGTATTLINKPLVRKNYYFCSQFVSEVLIKSGVYETDKLPELIQPMDLLEMPNKTLVYEGLINNDSVTEEYIPFFSYERLSKALLRFRS